MIRKKNDSKAAKDKENGFQDQLRHLNSQLFNLYKTSATLQESTDADQIYEIAIKTFEKLGYDRIRIYSIRNFKLYGRKCNYIPDEIFRKLVFDIAEVDDSKTYLAMKYLKPVILKTRTDEEERRVLRKVVGMESASLPLVFQNKVIGQISVDNEKSRKPLEKDDLNFLMTFANQIATAIHNAELYKENQNKLATLTALYDITSTINLSLDLDKIINLIVIKIIKLLKVNICTILILNDEKKSLIRTKSYGIPEETEVQREFSIEGSCFAEPMKELKIQYFARIDTKRYEELEGFRLLGATSMLSVPLFIENTPIGIINIFSKKERSFSKEEINLLNALSNQAAIAIENSRLYERIWSDKENLSNLLEISEDINSILNLPLLFESILEKTISLTGSDFGEFMMIEDEFLSVRMQHSKEGIIHPGDKRIRLKGSRFEEILLQHKSIIINDVLEMLRGKNDSDFCMNPGICSKAIIPLLINDIPIGIINLESRKKNKYKRFRKSLEILTNQIAIAIENAKLYDEVRDFNKKLQDEVFKATKELREKNQELKKMDRMKSEFVSNVSHELRTPLTSIAGYSKLILAEKLGPITEQQLQGLKIVVEESDRLTRLINDVLDLSKLEAGKEKPKLESMDINDMIDESVKAMSMSAREKNIDLAFDKHEHIPNIMASHDLIKQVLLNLISNAIKFTPSGGKVIVSAGIKKNFLEVSVADTGIGISKEHQKKIFDKFYQVDSSMTKSEGGTGLGLVIAKRIIDMHKGDIKIKSQKGKGSTFTFSLPLNSMAKPKTQS